MTTTDRATPDAPPLDLAAIEARADAATPGPWYLDELTMGIYPIEGGDGVAYDTIEANGEFIAAAREDVPALVAEVKRLRELVRGAAQRT